MANTHASWTKVRDAHRALEGVTLRDLFASDPDRFAHYSTTACDLIVDYSKQRINRDALDALHGLAEAVGIAAARDSMVAGQPINTTEDRAVRHIALRAPRAQNEYADVADSVDVVRTAMLAFAGGVRRGEIAAADGAPFTDVINIGIGGSDLGPVLATDALTPYRDGPRVHFVSNVDSAHFADTVAALDPARTLVLVASKSFTTIETMMNAQTARAWIVNACGEEAVADHFAALSTNLAAVSAFGIRKDRAFGFWDWVGGRYSLWSAIGLPVAIAIGPDNFQDMLAGAHAMDEHFRTAQATENLPVLMALLGIWNRNIEGHQSLAILPYDQRLARLPAYIQQLDMESNGKSVTRDGAAVETQTAPVIWGEPGTNSQHAFFQMMHQGTTIVPADFLIAANAHEADPAVAEHHIALVANCLAQSEAFAIGETTAEAHERLLRDGTSGAEADRLAAHKTFPGNRPSSTILYPKLTPSVFGQLLALYEHKVFLQGVIWDINSYDQWGVQLGKILASELTSALQGATVSDVDRLSSTRGLLSAVQRLRGS